jgi:RHS repeat-associated protein
MSLEMNKNTTQYIYYCEVGMSVTHKQNDEILDCFKYSYDPSGNITQIDKHRKGVDVNSGIFSYAYDKLGRLTDATNNQSSKQYQYDSLGNRIMSVQNGIETRHSYNARNQLIRTTEGDAVKDYEYDKRGNLKSILENGAITSSFEFNAANRMTEAITSKGKAKYEYNGFLKRASKLETLQQDGTAIPDPLQEVKYTLDLTKPYNDLLSIGEQRFVWGNELLTSEGSDNNEQFSYLNDHLGSPIRLMGNSQAETLSYDEFGVPLIDASTSINTKTNNSHNNTNHFHNPFGFTGYQSDNVSDLYYAQARYYKPSVGRFGAQDMHWHPGNIVFGDTYYLIPHSNFIPDMFAICQSGNRYSYALNNPNIYVDKNGEIINVLVGAAVGTAAGFFGSVFVQGVSNLISGESFIDIDWGEARRSAAAGAVARALTSVGVPPAVTGAIVGAGSNLVSQLSQNKWDIRQVDVGQVAVSAGIGMVVGGVFGAGPNIHKPHLVSMEKALYKRVGNALSHNLGNGAMREIGKAGRHYLSQTSTLWGRTIGIGFAQALRENIVNGVLHQSIGSSNGEVDSTIQQSECLS